ncbi:hypothetical protein HDE_07841 [Halotydeus destructor]|nr:hypothetical protein HDE_07841 [Halotydeus destructor]
MLARLLAAIFAGVFLALTYIDKHNIDVVNFIRICTVDTWPDIIGAVYLNYFAYIYYLEKSYKETTLHRLSAAKMADSKIDYKREIVTRRAINAMKSKFDNLFNIIPAAALFFQFVYTAGFIVLYRNHKKDGHRFIRDLPFYTIYNTARLAGFILTCFYQDKMKANNKDLVDNVIAHEGRIRSETQALITEISTTIPLTGLGQFTIDWSLLASFAGSLLSYTVLLLQLTQAQSVQDCGQ